MRLTTAEIDCITTTIHAFDTNAKVYLFGSRVNDNARGGDIDLLVLSAFITLADQLKIKVKLYDLIGEQKIDLIVRKDGDSVFAKHAIKTGILLCPNQN